MRISCRPIDIHVSERAKPLSGRREAQLRELERVARLTGTVEEVQAIPWTDGKMLLIGGRVRLEAALAAGLPRLRADRHDSEILVNAVQRALDAARLRGNPMDLARDLAVIQDAVPTLTHADLADLIGWSRNGVAHLLLLLTLPHPVQILMEENRLSFGHGKALCSRRLTGNDAQKTALAEAASTGGWSVRELEAAIREEEPASNEGLKSTDFVRSPDVTRLETQIQEGIGLRTTIEHTVSGRGRFIIEYDSLEQADNLLRHLPLETE